MKRGNIAYAIFAIGVWICALGFVIESKVIDYTIHWITDNHGVYALVYGPIGLSVFDLGALIALAGLLYAVGLILTDILFLLT